MSVIQLILHNFYYILLSSIGFNTYWSILSSVGLIINAFLFNYDSGFQSVLKYLNFVKIQQVLLNYESV